MDRTPTAKLVYEGKALTIEFYISELGICPAEVWLEIQPESRQHKYAALFEWMGDHGKIWNEQKFKHLADTNQLFEFKVDETRVLCFFVVGKRLILTHGFSKKGGKTPRNEIARAELIQWDFLEREKQ